jgi:hypothetical protein
MEQKGKSDLAGRLYYEGPRQSTGDHLYLTGSDLDTDGWYVSLPEKRYFRGDFANLLRKNEIVYFNEDVFNLPEKIVWRQTSDRIRAAIVGKHWFGNTLQAGIPRTSEYDLRYILGLLNSKFLNFIYRETTKESGRVFPQVKMGKVRALPFRTIDFADNTDKKLYDDIVRLVETMVSLHKRRSAYVGAGHERTVLERQIEATDREMDRLVYTLYGPSQAEIDVIEHQFLPRAQSRTAENSAS